PSRCGSPRPGAVQRVASLPNANAGWCNCSPRSATMRWPPWTRRCLPCLMASRARALRSTTPAGSVTSGHARPPLPAPWTRRGGDVPQDASAGRRKAGHGSQKAVVRFPPTPGIWGRSFLFVRVAEEHVPPSAVVFGRSLLGTAFLVPLSLRNQAFRGLRRAILPVVVVTLLDMALPPFLTAWGEQHVSSSAAGILTATDPLFTALLAFWLIRSEAVNRKR